MDATKGILLTCQHCYNTWRYKGKSKHYATCTRCYYKVKVQKRRTPMNINEDAFDLARKLMQGRTETYVVGGGGELVGLGITRLRRWYE